MAGLFSYRMGLRVHEADRRGMLIAATDATCDQV
jgi:hypothetical protein